MMLPQNAVPLIPQKAPFVMVDQLLYVDDTTARTSFIINPDNVLVENGFFQEGGLLENMAQTAAALAGYEAAVAGEAVQPGYITLVKEFEIHALPKVRSTLQTEVKIENQIFGVTVVTGKVWQEEKLIASCEMKIFIRNIEG